MIIKSVKVNAIAEKDFSIHLENGRSDYLYVLFKTKTMLYADGNYVLVEPGTGIFYDKNIIQSYYGCDGTEFNHDFLLFDIENEFENHLFLNVKKNKPLQHLSPERISDAIYAIEKEWSPPQKFSREIQSGMGIVFLYKILGDLDSFGDKPLQHYETFCELRHRIYREPFLEWSIDQISQNLCFSRYHFQHLYKDFFGISCINDVIRARVDMAENLLLRTDMSISDISEKCGYKNVEHFIRQFTKSVGFTPKKFRSTSIK